MITAKERQDFLETIPIFAGLNASKRLAQDGAAVLVHYSVSGGRAEGVANEIQKAGGSAEIVRADQRNLLSPCTRA